MMRQDGSAKSLPAGFAKLVLDIFHQTVGVREDSSHLTVHAEPDHH
jgi:hypothetical protein